MTEITPTLAERIAKASIQVGAFVADKQNRDQGYAYISADQVLDRCGDALAKNGVIVIPEIEEVTLTTVERAGRSARIDASLVIIMTITDGKDAATAKWCGIGSDYSTPDKAVYKAITSGHKYFLMKLLNIGVGNEDSEHEPAEKEQPRQNQTEQKPAEILEAEALTNSDGVKYGDIPTDTLALMANSMTKALAKDDVTPEYKEITGKKLVAAKSILNWRKSH